MVYQAGYIEGEFVDESRLDWNGLESRPVKWCCWYPAPSDVHTEEHLFGGSEALPLFTQGLIAKNVEISNKKSKWPLVLLSHGTGGSANGMGWLATRLAQRGYICVGVDHHGNTASEPYRAEGFICWWERPSDFSLIIDRVDQIPPIQNKVSVEEISFAGFSLGGYTGLALVGAITSMEQFVSWLNENPNPIGGPREFPHIDREISRLMSDSERFRQSWNRQGELYLDPRISKCVAIAPAPPIRAFLTLSLSSIECPVFIISGESDLEAPFEECALWLSEQNPSFRLKSLGRDVGHYAFIAECTEHGRCTEPDICLDPTGTIRSNIHNDVASMIGEFLNSN